MRLVRYGRSSVAVAHRIREVSGIGAQVDPAIRGGGGQAVDEQLRVLAWSLDEDPEGIAAIARRCQDASPSPGGVGEKDVVLDVVDRCIDLTGNAFNEHWLRTGCDGVAGDLLAQQAGLVREGRVLRPDREVGDLGIEIRRIGRAEHRRGHDRPVQVVARDVDNLHRFTALGLGCRDQCVIRGFDGIVWPHVRAAATAGVRRDCGWAHHDDAVASGEIFTAQREQAVVVLQQSGAFLGNLLRLCEFVELDRLEVRAAAGSTSCS